MKKIEFTTEVKFGDKVIDTITVAPLTFVDLVKLWNKAVTAPGAYEVEMQRARIGHQAHFMSDGKRIIPDKAQLAQLPRAVAMDIIAGLENGGEYGEVLTEGDGITTPVHIRLGTPIEMKDGKGNVTAIAELEFVATTYGEVEEILAADGELNKTLALLRTLAAPVGSSLTRLPAWALDRITPADGLLVMRKVLPSF